MLPDSVVRDQVAPPAEAYCTVQPAMPTVAVPRLYSPTRWWVCGARVLPPPPYTWLTTRSADAACARAGAASTPAATTPTTISVRLRMRSAPDVADRADRAGAAGATQAIDAFQCTQHGVVRDVFGVCPGGHVRAVEQRRDAVAGAVVVLVERHEQQAVVGLRPGGVRAEVVLQPGVAGRHGAVVHVVAQVRHDDRDLRQRREVGREPAEPQVARRRDVREVHPRVVLAGVRAGRAAGVPVRRHALRVPGERPAGRDELVAQVLAGVGVR